MNKYLLFFLILIPIGIATWWLLKSARDTLNKLKEEKQTKIKLWE